MTLQPGDKFDHYEICSYIAQGGTGDVYRAVDIVSRRDVALKIPLRSTVLDPLRYERFVREVDALNVLHHPSIQHCLETGRFENTPFLVTELVEGQSLREVIHKNNKLSVAFASGLIRKIADGMAYCHAQNVVHRDLKPENIIVVTKESPIIIDFGLALTKNHPFSREAVGTPDYMAPEQIQGLCGDKRIDVYAVGIIFYEMLAGHPPYTSDSPTNVYSMHLTEPILRLDKVVSEVSSQLATVIAKCLQRNPEQRYPDMQAFLDDLEHLERVDISKLDGLSAAPPKPSFLQTEIGQGILTTVAMILGIIALTVLLVGLKH